jgi:hypothetical protein
MADIQSFGTEEITLSKAVRDYRPRCPGCTPAKATADGARPCSFYDCPGLPAELHVTCDLCMYDFSAHDGQPTCDHSTCDTARRLQGNVETYRKWLQLLKDEAAASASGL